MKSHCACTVPGMVCAQHKHLPPHERPQPPLFGAIVDVFARHLETDLEAQVKEWSHELGQEH